MTASAIIDQPVAQVSDDFEECDHAQMLEHLGDLDHYSSLLDNALSEHGFPPLGVDRALYDEVSNAAFNDARRTRGELSLAEAMGRMQADIQTLRERLAVRRPDAPGNFYDWISAYRPVLNHFRPCAPLGGFMFETIGEELAYVNMWPADRIWTYVVDEDGERLVSGAHLVNRLGYLLTAVSTPKDERITIEIW